MLQRSSSVLHRVGSYFGVEDTDENSLDMWREKVERTAKMKGYSSISLANLFPSDVQDPDENIRVLEEIVSNPSLVTDEGYSLSTHSMLQSDEKIVSIQEPELDNEVIMLQDMCQSPNSVQESTNVKFKGDKVSVPSCETDIESTMIKGVAIDKSAVEECSHSKDYTHMGALLVTVNEATDLYGLEQATGGIQEKPIHSPCDQHVTSHTLPMYHPCDIEAVGGSQACDVGNEKAQQHRRSSVSFSPNVSVIEFDSPNGALSSLKSLLKFRRNDTSDTCIQDSNLSSHQYQVTLRAPTASSDKVVDGQKSMAMSARTSQPSIELADEISFKQIRAKTEDSGMSVSSNTEESMTVEDDHKRSNQDQFDVSGSHVNAHVIVHSKRQPVVDNGIKHQLYHTKPDGSVTDSDIKHQLYHTKPDGSVTDEDEDGYVIASEHFRDDTREAEFLPDSEVIDNSDKLYKAREDAVDLDMQKALLQNLKKHEELLDVVMQIAKEQQDAIESTGKQSLLRSLLPFKRKSSHVIIHPTLSSQIRIQIEGLPDYKPYMTLLITFTQLIVFMILCTFGGLAPIGLRPKTVYLDGVKTFRGTETVVGIQYPNVWIGPTSAYWIRHGALFAPCLRSDHKINAMYSKQGYHEATNSLGCCEVQNRNTAGTTTIQECDEYTYGVGLWRPVECGQRVAGDNNVAHILKPCCYRLTGECKLTTHQHCTFLGGYYHAKGPEHCSQVNCLADVCHLSLSMEADPELAFMPLHPNQWWRLLITPFYHNGILHLLLVLIPQLLLAIPIERMAGGVRLFLIYMSSAVFGHLLAALFTPYLPHMGGSAAVCALIAVQAIELAQSWVLVERPQRTILKIVSILVIFVLSGTLPFLDNFAHIGGLLTGVLTAFIFLPYVVFGQWHSRRRRLILILAVPILTALVSLLLLLFYKMQYVDSCPFCQYINCISYTPFICNSTWYNPQPQQHLAGPYSV